MAVHSNGKAVIRVAKLWLCDEKRSTGKAKMANVMAERSGAERRQSKDLESIGKTLSSIAMAKQ